MQKIAGLLIIISVVAVTAASFDTSRNQKSPQDANVSVESLPQTRATINTNGDAKMFGSLKKVSQVEHAGDDDFQQKVLDASEPVLVDFYADWCGPCRMIGPVLEELAREFPTARIVKVNVDQSPNLAATYGIESIPALMVFQNGRMVNRHVGLANKAQLQSMLGL